MVFNNLLNNSNNKKDDFLNKFNNSNGGDDFLTRLGRLKFGESIDTQFQTKIMVERVMRAAGLKVGGITSFYEDIEAIGIFIFLIFFIPSLPIILSEYIFERFFLIKEKDEYGNIIQDTFISDIIGDINMDFDYNDDNEDDSNDDNKDDSNDDPDADFDDDILNYY